MPPGLATAWDASENELPLAVEHSPSSSSNFCSFPHCSWIPGEHVLSPLPRCGSPWRHAPISAALSSRQICSSKLLRFSTHDHAATSADMEGIGRHAAAGPCGTCCACTEPMRGAITAQSQDALR